jgi:DNA-directed RNA polymerase subunit E'/Rpb7
MNDNIMNAPHGMNLVIECKSGTVVIGRFDESNGFEVIMHDVDIWEPKQGEVAAPWIRETATYGVDVKQRNFKFAALDVVKWTPLGDIEKLV